VDEQDIKDRLTRLEVASEERWMAHDNRANERWVDLMEKFHEVSRKLDQRQCVEHSELLLGINHRITILERWNSALMWAVGVVYIAIVGAITRILIN